MKRFFISSILWLAVSHSMNNLYAQVPPQDCGPFVYPVVPNELDTVVSPTFTQSPPPPPPPPSDTNRVIHWIHGLSGTEEAWAQAITATTAPTGSTPGYPRRKAYSNYVDYSLNTSSIDNAIQNSYIDMGAGNAFWNSNGVNVDPGRSMIIAHSQGGIVARGLDLAYDDPNFLPQSHGIVTFGTPHAGARILTNKDLIFSTLEEGCSALIAGPTYDITDNIPGIVQAIMPGLGSSIRDKIDNVLCGQVVPVAVNAFAGKFLAGTTDAYCDTCSFVTQTLQNHTNFHSVHRVAFWGEEDNAELLRLLHFQVAEQVNDPDPFEANYDSSLLLIFDTLMMNYKMKVDQYQHSYNVNSSPLWFGGAFLPHGPLAAIGLGIGIIHQKKAEQAAKARDAYKSGVNFMSTLNDKWLSIIGGYENVPLNITGCFCDAELQTGEEFSFEATSATTATACLHYVSMLPPSQQQQYASITCNWADVNETIRTKVPTDAVVTAPSAMAFPGAGNNRAPMPGSNHFQMRNDENTRLRLLELWTSEYGDFFFTEVR